jgi:hypothetical protein
VVISGPCKIRDDRFDYRDYSPTVVRAQFAWFGIIIREAVPEVKFGPP